MPKRDPLLSVTCHDLRTPLAALTMGAHFVLQSSKEDPRTQRIAQAMVRSCAQMDRLLGAFSDLSEIEAAEIPLELADCDARMLAELAAKTAQGDAEARGIQVVVSVPPAPLPLRCDAARLQRALAALVDNALRYAPEGSRLDIAAERAADRLRLSVTDAGPGPNAEVEPHLFDRTWHRLQKNRPGPGLGLAIAQGFAAAHGGSVTFEREAGFTTFAIVLDGG